MLCRIFDPDFRRGWQGLDEEQQREVFAEYEKEAAAAGEDGEDVTNYEVEAFIDEDQLK